MNAPGFTSRMRFAAVVEWLMAAVFLTGTLAVGGMLLGGLRVPRVASASAASPAVQPLPSTAPPSIPSGAVSVPVLPLADGKELRIGDSVQSVAARLGRAAESGRQEVDRGSLGERLTRFYDYAGSRFILVFEPFEQNGEARLAAIYLPERSARNR